MGFLADVGRARPDVSIQNFMKTEAALRQSEAQAALTGATTQQVLEKTEALRNQQAYLQKQRAEKEAWEKSPVNIKAHPYFLNIPDPTLQKQVFDYFHSQGIVDENGVGRRKDILRVLSEIEGTTKGLQTFIKPIVDHQEAQLQQLQLAIQEEQAKPNPNPKKLQELVQKRDQLAAQFNQASTVLSEAMKAAQEREQARLRQKLIPWGQTKEGVVYKERKGIEKAKIAARAKIKAASEKKKQGKTYTKQQLVDDTRAYYFGLMKPLTNPLTG
ncbi:MAG: hypothetical protein JRI35_09715, partial [Deltaproteobacteria bacterium]|nr:hypothetical protein [Deltaproteobacteria bacterium]